MNEKTAQFSLRGLFQPRDLTEGTPWKTILAFALPIIISYLLQQVYTISDAAIVGQTLTAGEVAGVNDTTSIIFIFLQFAFGVSAGFCVVTAAEVGAHHEAGVRRSLAAQILLSAALTVLLTGLALLLLKPMLAWINVTPESPEVYRAAHTYCAIIFAGIGAQLFYNFICSFLRSMGDSVTPLLFLLFSTILNIGLDLLFIVSFHWGVAGAAIATVLAQGISAVLGVVYILRGYPELRFTPRQLGAATRRAVTSMFWAGLSMGLMSAIYNLGSVALQSSINALGSVYITAQTAARRLAELYFIPGGALGIGVATFSSQNLGAGRRSRIWQSVKAALAIYFVWWVFVMAFTFLLGGAAIRGITGSTDEVIISNALLYLKISAPVIPPMAVLVILRNMLQGIRHTVEPLLASGLELVGKVIFAVWLVPVRGYRAVCFCEPTTWVVCFVFILLPGRFARRRKNLIFFGKRACNLEVVLL